MSDNKEFDSYMEWCADKSFQGLTKLTYEQKQQIEKLEKELKESDDEMVYFSNVSKSLKATLDEIKESFEMRFDSLPLHYRSDMKAILKTLEEKK